LSQLPERGVGGKGTVPDLETEQSGVVELGLSPKFVFGDPRKELVSKGQQTRNSEMPARKPG